MPHPAKMEASSGSLPAGADPRLDRLVREGLLDTAFQPIVDLRRGIVLGLEALCRPRPESGFANAGELFDAAAAADLLWVVERVARLNALRSAASWKGSVLLFMNCSPQVFGDSRFADTVRDELMLAGGIAPGRVVLEITERSEAPFASDLLEQAHRVKDHGFQLAIDDVGAGTSGLSRIMLLRPNWLKLDRELVASVDRDRVRQNLIRFMLHFGRLSGVQIVAEGIEEASEVASLMELGVGVGQGYFLGRPGEPRQSLDPGVLEAMRNARQGTDAGHSCDPSELNADAYGRAVVALDGSDRVSQAARQVLRDPGVPGVAVTEDGRLVGWCARDQLLRAASDARASCSLGMVARPCATAPADGTNVLSLLELAACREESAAAGPVLLVKGDTPVGVLTVSDLLHAALDACRTVRTRTAPLTGLPGRVCCDQHLTELLEARVGDAASVQARIGYDAAVIDVRGFSTYNAAYGYDMGDALIQHLVSLLRGTVVGDDPHTFLGHLSDDRFLVTALQGTLEMRLLRLVYRFDRSARQFWCLLDDGRAAPDLPTTGTNEEPAAVGIRVLLVRDVLSRATRPQDVLLIADRLRRRNEEGISPARPSGGSILLADEPSQPAAPELRLSA
ncbi:MAG TPA: EAL domain-containing protein [Phycisphaerales bacterium]|nr:EAL domain-containing protein [Phycisphaerales bacterium]